MQEKSNLRTAGIVLASVLVLVSLIVLAYLYFTKQEAPGGIVLPGAQVVGPEQTPSDSVRPEEFAVLDAENVLQVLETLEKNSTYREVLNLTEYWPDGSATRIAEVYHRSGVSFIQVQAAKKTQCYLSDGEELYTWYLGDESAVSVPLRNDLTLEDFVGTPLYFETLRRTKIEEATYLPADEQNSDRIYIRSVDEAAVAYQFWINIETALPVRVEILQGDTMIHLVEQREIEILMPGDSALTYAFLLPDGTDPFAH